MMYVNSREPHLSQIIHTVMNYFFLVFLLVECPMDNIYALELVEHGHSDPNL